MVQSVFSLVRNIKWLPNLSLCFYPYPLHCVFHTKARVILVKFTVDLVTALLKTPKASTRLKENWEFKTLNGLVLLPLCFHLLVHFFHHQPYGLLRCSLNPPQHTPTSKTCFFISKYLYSSLFTLFTIQINDSLPERPYLTVYSV